MTDYDLTPVEGDPFRDPNLTLTPVEGNPFEKKPDLAPLDIARGNPFAMSPGEEAFSGDVPEAFLDRVRRGQALKRIVDKAVSKGVEGFGEEPIGLSPEHAIQLHDTLFKGSSPVNMLGEGGVHAVAGGLEAIMRSVEAGIHGAGGAWGQINDELGASQGGAQRAENEVINAGNWAMIEAGFGHFARPHVADMGISDQAIGGLPKDGDFKNAAAISAAPGADPAVVEGNLRGLWQERGAHPAEAAHDAQGDAFLRQELGEPKPTDAELAQVAAKAVDLGPAEAPEPIAPDEPLRAVGAEVTREENLPSLEEQPAPRAGSLTAALKDAGDRLLDVGQDIQMLTAPMATGSKGAMAIAKDFANAMRRNRWEWSRIDRDVADRFTPEQRGRMWDAADEESVARQLGESTEHQGLTTLEPEESAAVEDLQARAQNAWLRAKDLGMVEGEGLPAYTPRMLINVANSSSGDRAAALNVMGRNLKVRTGQMLSRKHMTAEETEAAAKAKFGDEAQIARDIRALPLATAKLEDAIAGRSLINNIEAYGKQTGDSTVVEGGKPAGSPYAWFTMDHPAFRKWRPKLETDPETGATRAAVDAGGNAIFEQVPIYVRSDFEGPLRAVLTQKSGATYNGLMALKGKTMGLIMNSPLIHNAVEWGRAMPAMPGKVATFKVYFEGNRAKHDPVAMREAIDAGLVPIGHRFFNQDISSIMEEPNLAPGRSWTAQVLGAVPGLFDEGAGNAVKAAIDKAGDFWHNTLLWDRVGDLQMGLYANFRDDLLEKGVDRQTATRAAAHWANRYAGALPQEAMSDGARKITNLLLFSRSFTLGNVGAMKDILTGLPRDVMAQVERDVGSLNPEAKDYIKSAAKRKAFAVVALDMGLMYVGNSLLQNAMNVLFNDSTLDKEMHGYAERLGAELTKVKEHPLALLQPLSVIESLSATSENEPGKQDRIRVGQTDDGTAMYARNPVGKIGEEFLGYMTGPLDMLRRKLGTIARPAWQIMANDAGFGRKVYDPNAATMDKYLQNIGLIVAHLVKSQLPEGQISAFADLVKGEGDKKVNLAGAFGPVLGVTVSKGAPGGPAVGELYKAKEEHQYALDAALPDIRKQIKRGDIQGARDRMTDLGVAPALQSFYVRTSQNPATRLSGRTLRDFYMYSTPEQRARFEAVR